MFEKIGRKLIRGAKAEMLGPPGTDGKDALCDLILGIGKITLFGLALLLDGGSSGNKKGQTSTVIVNNYIYKEEKE